MSRDPRDEFILEHEVQKACIEYLQLRGFRTWRIGQRDARGTQDPGPADVFATHPRFGQLWVECKRAIGGRQSVAQRLFQQAVEAAGGRYVLAPSVTALVCALTTTQEEAVHG